MGKYFLRQIIIRIENLKKIPEESCRWNKIPAGGSRNTMNMRKPTGSRGRGGGGDPEKMGKASPQLWKSLVAREKEGVDPEASPQPGMNFDFEEQLLDGWLEKCQTKIICLSILEECILNASNRLLRSEPADELTTTAPPPSPPPAAIISTTPPKPILTKPKPKCATPHSPSTKLTVKKTPKIEKIQKTIQKRKFEEYFKPKITSEKARLTPEVFSSTTKSPKPTASKEDLTKLNKQPKVKGTKVGNLLKIFQQADRK